MKLLGISEFFTALRTELAWDKDRAIDAMKVGLTCVAGFLVADWREFERPYWILVTILMVSQASYGSVVEKVAMRALATVIGMGLGVLFTTWFPQDHLLLAGCYAALVFVSAVGSRGAWHPQAFVMACVYSGGIGSLALSDPTSIPDFFYDRCVDIGIGSLLVLIVFRYVAPRFAARQLVESFALFCEHTGECIERRRNAAARKAAGLLSSMTANFQQGLLEGEALPFSKGSWARLLAKAESIAARLVILSNRDPYGGNARLEELFGPSMEVWRHDLSDSLGQVAVAIRAGNALQPMRKSAGKEEFETLLQAVRAERGFHEIPNAALLQFETWADELSLLTEDIGSMADALPEQSKSERHWRLPEGRTIFPITSVALLHGLRVTVSIGVVVWLGLIFNWQQIVSVVFTAGLIIQSTHGGSVRKAMLRLVGCVFGGMLAVLTALVVFPSVDTWWQFAPWLFLMMGLCGYVALGSPRYSYAGLQAGLCYVIVLFQDYQPTTDLAPIGQRIGAILVGGVVALAVTRYLFPERATNSVRAAILDAIAAVRETLRFELESPNAGESQKPRARLAVLRERLRQLNTAILEARSETLSTVLHSHELLGFAGSLHDVAYELIGLTRERVPEGLFARLRPGLTAVAGALDAALTQMSEALDHGRAVEEQGNIAAAVARLDAELNLLRSERLTQPYEAHAAMAFFSWVDQVRAIADLLATTAAATPRIQLAELAD